MNKKGQMSVGLFLSLAVGIIIALVLLQAASTYTGQATNTVTGSAKTYTAPVAGSRIDLVGQELLSTPVVTNATNVSEVVPTNNYTIAETVSATDGLKRISYTSSPGIWEGRNINISYNYGAEGYVDDAGGRGITGIILILAAIAIIMFALYPTIRSKFD